MTLKRPKLFSNMTNNEKMSILLDVYDVLFVEDGDLIVDKDLGSEEMGELVNIFSRRGLDPVEVK